MKLGNKNGIKYQTGSSYFPNQIQKKFELRLRDQLYIILAVLIISGLIRYPAVALKAMGSNLSYFVSKQTDASAHTDAKAIDPIDSQNIYNPVTSIEERTTGQDFRVKRLQDYLDRYDSPLKPYAAYIVEQSDLNGVDWTLLVAISKIESDLCKNTVDGSHNCWGLGGSNFIHFASYEEGIKFEAELLNKQYRLQANRGIKEKYCPASDGCNDKWSNTVTDTSSELVNKDNGN